MARPGSLPTCVWLGREVGAGRPAQQALFHRMPHTLSPSWAKSLEAKHSWLPSVHEDLLQWLCPSSPNCPLNTPLLRTPVLGQGWEADIMGWQYRSFLDGLNG